jgi:hypothetical protein
MKRYRILVLACAAVILGALLYYFYGGSTPPAGQHDLVRLNTANFAELQQAFNAEVNRVRLIAMLSPT